MLFLTATTDKFQLVTSAAVNTDVHVSYADHTSTTFTPGRQNTAITTAATTDVLAAPGASTQRQVKAVTIRNKGSTSQTVTFVFNQNGTSYEIHKATLRPDDMLQYVDGAGWMQIPFSIFPLSNESTANQGPGFATDTYITGSSLVIPSGWVAVGALYRLRISVGKTAAGTAATTINIRIGAAGSVADTSRVLFTMGLGTAAVDTGYYEITAMFRTVGASAVLQGTLALTSNLTITGLSNAVKAREVTGGAFNSSAIVGQIIGASYNGGASAAHTMQWVRSQLVEAGV
jgi:hypothetical protein